ncbi:MAG: isoleucine--tRNA ligase [Candidatus Krumholzibacteriales bacterium]
MSEEKTTEIYPGLHSQADAVTGEEELLRYWEKHDIFHRSVRERPEDNCFVFYEGPPTANGRPGVHHAMSRTIKDIICRYKTMRGFRVERKAGWDTHGLPVEIEVENKLGLDGKDQIEEYGVAEFNAECRKSVFKYLDEWHEFTRKLGFWLDLDDPYVTCTNEYIESVWWILKQFWDQGYLYEGHKIVPYCPRCGTSLSSHEVSQGYREVADPSIYFKLKIAGEEGYFLVWTTTPWTLISNVALAVGPEYDYVKIRHEGDILVLAEALLGVLEGDYEVLEKFKGSKLAGRRYEPCFPYFKDAEGGFRVIEADFVTLTDGTGIVHTAPAFGEDDYRAGTEENLPFVQPVDREGRFTDEIEKWAGRFVKDCDEEIIADLEERGLLYRSEEIRHSYPFCWRCDSPLLYYARRSWYIKTTAFKDLLISANSNVQWYPPDVGEKRFARWLEGNVDWALSRERYWGTPLNIWTCDSCGEKYCIGDMRELRSISERMPEDFDLHKPFVDDLDVGCPECGGKMTRESEVIDCWFDSGSMPFAQYHYPIENINKFKRQYPAEFISEGVDQSRGWFYSLLVIGAFLTKESPYRRCLPHGMVLDNEGLKMSKSRGNAVYASEALEQFGADALRWFLMTSGAPHLPKRFDSEALLDSANRFVGTFRNLYNFFAMYARIDEFVPSLEAGTDNIMDRWLLSRFNSTVKDVTEALEDYDITRAGRILDRFVVDELSNWYLRSCRRRFWKNEMSGDKRDAYETFYLVLRDISRLMAPVLPFISEAVFLRLQATDLREGSSVHLSDYPQPEPDRIDPELERKMEEVLRVVTAGRAARNRAGIKVRTPLSELLVYSAGEDRLDWLDDEDYLALVRSELNIKKVSRIESTRDYITLRAKPEYSILGKRFGSKMKDAAGEIESFPQDTVRKLESRGEIIFELGGEKEKLKLEEVNIEREVADDYMAGHDGEITAIIKTLLTPELIREGMARDLVNRIQNFRKESGFEVSDRIMLAFTGSKDIEEVMEEYGEYIRNETLTESIENGEKEWPHETGFELSGQEVKLWTRKK